MRRMIRQILENGVTPTLTRTERKQVVLLNAICATWCILVVLLLLNDLYFIYIAEDTSTTSRQSYQEVVLWDLAMFVILFATLWLQRLGTFTWARWFFVSSVSIRSILFSNFVQAGQLFEYGYVSIPLFALLFIRGLYSQLLFLALAIGATFYTTGRADLYQDSPSLNPFMLSLFFAGVFIAIKYFQEANKKSELLLEEERNSALNNARIIEAQHDELTQLSEFKNHFFVNISHEIRTPLTLISGYARKLYGSINDRQQAAQAEIILDESAKIKNLIDNIIDLSKLDNDQFTIHKEETNFSLVLRKAHASFVGLFEDSGIQLHLELDVSDCFIICDRMLMEKVIGNLLTNALKFSHENTATCMALDSHTSGLKLTVTNYGVSIPSEDLPRLFDRFYQSANPITESQGSGIGLSITKAILDNHDFDVTVSSQQNGATAFVIDIPEEAVAAVPLDFSDSAIENPTSQSTFTLLLVEDNKSMRDYMRSMDVLKSYHILEASQGYEALDLLEKNTIDLVISDYMMPSMNGLELAKQMKERDFLQPIIIVTAQTAEQHKLNLLRIGIDGYLTKPFMEEELANLIKKSLAYDTHRKSYLAALHENAIDTLPLSDLDRFSQSLNAIIQNKLADEDLSISYLCDELHTTERTLFRRVRELTGGTPAKLIFEARMRRAKAYYDQQTFKSARQLALAVGFKNSTRFTRKFKDAYGIDLTVPA